MKKEKLFYEKPDIQVLCVELSNMITTSDEHIEAVPEEDELMDNIIVGARPDNPLFNLLGM